MDELRDDRLKMNEHAQNSRQLYLANDARIQGHRQRTFSDDDFPVHGYRAQQSMRTSSLSSRFSLRWRDPDTWNLEDDSMMRSDLSADFLPRRSHGTSRSRSPETKPAILVGDEVWLTKPPRQESYSRPLTMPESAERFVVAGRLVWDGKLVYRLYIPGTLESYADGEYFSEDRVRLARHGRHNAPDPAEVLPVADSHRPTRSSGRASDNMKLHCFVPSEGIDINVLTSYVKNFDETAMVKHGRHPMDNERHGYTIGASRTLTREDLERIIQDSKARKQRS